MLVLLETVVRINGDLQIFKECLKNQKCWKNSFMFYMHMPVNLFIILAVGFNICKGYSFSLNES